MKEVKLKKSINVFDLIFLAFGAMIGWGWVVASGGWIQNAGVLGTVIGFVLGGLMIFFVGLIYAELTTAMPQTGGEMIFSYRAFGPRVSFVCTWAIILSYIGVVCFEACSFPTILQYIFPGFLKGHLYTVAGFDVYATWLAVAILSALLITYINVRGVKVAARFQNILTAIIAIVGIILVAVSAINGEVSNIEPQLFKGDGTGGIIKSILSIAVIAPFFLFGFDVIPQAAEEINVPLKKIGKVLILSIVLAVGFYALVVLAIGYAMSPEEITGSMKASGLVAADAMGKMFNSMVMAKVAIIGGMCGILTSWNSFLLGASRAIFSLGRIYMIPPFFGKIHDKYQTPANALWFVGILSALSVLCGRVMLTWVSDVASLACCFAYFMVSISFVVLRFNDKNLERPYRVQRARIVGIVAIIMTGIMVLLFLIPGSGATLLPQEFAFAGGWLILGLVLGLYSQKKYRKERVKVDKLPIAKDRVQFYTPPRTK